MKNSVLVTGGCGFLGTTLVEQLLQRFDELNLEKITIFDSLALKDDGCLPLLRDKRVDLVVGDVRNRDLFKSLIQSHNVIYPLAAIVGMPACKKKEDEAWSVNHTQINDISLLAGTDAKVIYPNTNSIYGQSNTPVDEKSNIKCLSTYAKSKWRAEQMVLDEIAGISLRLATLAGLSYRFRKDLLVNSMVLNALNPGYVILYEPDFQRNYISVRDAARAFIHSLVNYDSMKGQCYNTGNTKLNCSKMQLAQKIKEYVPNFVINVEPFAKDPDARSYVVLNDKLESTGFKCEDDFDTIIPQLISGYKVILECSSQYTNL